MKKQAIVILIGIIVLNVAQAFSQSHDVMMSRKFLKELNLTDEQKKDVDKIKFDVEKQMVAQKAKIATARIELQQLFMADSPDKATIEKKINEIATLNVQMRMIKINAWFSINKLLTPEQQKMWRKVLEKGHAKRHEKMMEHWGKHKMPLKPEEPMPH